MLLPWSLLSSVVRQRFCVLIGGLFVSSGLLADSPQIHTNRQSPQILPLPKGDDVFHFIVFGDRTGGPPEGVKILAQAVKDTNLLDPDMVLTVGDLIQGYNGQAPWEKQMTEFRSVMNGLRMPWFPVAGNHDIYWRGEGRPPTEHEANYEKHFGPLWYWFEHKKCGFVVMFSDEGNADNRVRDFDDPQQQQFSPAQKTWLKASLQEMKEKGLKHIFCFLHHPKWAPDLYPKTDWPEVHEMFKANGLVRGVFAGHIHRQRYDGKQDGIEYMALATTGGGIPGSFPALGYVHHFNVVTVRPEGIKVASVPVGVVQDPKMFTVDRAKDIDSGRKMNPALQGDPMVLNEDGLGAGVYTVAFTNPAERSLDVTLTHLPTSEWVISPDHAHTEIAPGQTKTLSFTWVRVKRGVRGKVTPPVFDYAVDYLEDGIRVPLPTRKYPAVLKQGSLPADAYDVPASEFALHILDDKSGIRVESAQFDLPDGSFTVECWAHPTQTVPNAALVAKTQSSDYGFLAENGVPSFLAYLGDRYAGVSAKAPLPLNTWTHLAAVYDGKELALYINGNLEEKVAASGVRQRNDLPLWIGADPNNKGEPTRSFHGFLDEVRMSTTPRYTQNFKPERRFEPDDKTALLFHLDEVYQNVIPDHSRSQAHGSVVGKVKPEPAPK